MAKMNSQSLAKPSSYLIIFLSFFILFSSTSAFNITKLLKFYDPDYSTFNDYLTQTHLAGEINRRQTITVLAVQNSAMSELSGKPQNVIKDIMSLHVVLDYYDVAKLDKISKKTTILTTLFQSTGIANNQQGFLNVSIHSGGTISFGSAVKGSQLNANLVKEVATQPYNISVLQVSSLIIPTGIENSPPAPPQKAPPVAPTHAPSVAPKPSKSRAPVASPPKKGKKGSAPEPSSDAPTADSPTDDSLASSPPSPVPAADSPVADGPASADADAAPAPKKSSGMKMKFGLFFGVLMVVLSSWVAL